MLYSFKVWFVRPDGEQGSDEVPARSPEEAQAIIERFAKVLSIGTGETRPLDPTQHWFNKEEAAIYCRAKQTYEDKSSLIDKLMADGILPRPKSGRPLFSRKMLDKAMARRMDVDLEDAA